MTVQAILLAVANAGRPTGLAAVYALLSGPRAKQALLAYTLAGLTWSVLVGVLVVEALHGARVGTGASEVNAVFEVLGGVVALGFAAGIATGRLSPRSRDEASREDSRIARRLRDPSLRVAAAAGIATHLPGLFYLLGLNEIAATDPGLTASVVQVVIFNAIWFSPPFAALLLSVMRPEATRELLGRLNSWARRYERLLIAALFALAGIWFTVTGAATLLSST